MRNKEIEKEILYEENLELDRKIENIKKTMNDKESFNLLQKNEQYFIGQKNFLLKALKILNLSRIEQL